MYFRTRNHFFHYRTGIMPITHICLQNWKIVRYFYNKYKFLWCFFEHSHVWGQEDWFHIDPTSLKGVHTNERPMWKTSNHERPKQKPFQACLCTKRLKLKASQESSTKRHMHDTSLLQTKRPEPAVFQRSQNLKPAHLQIRLRLRPKKEDRMNCTASVFKSIS